MSGNSGMVHLAEINLALPILNVAAYWKSSNTEAFAKKRNCLGYLQTTLMMGEGVGLRIYMRYCLKKTKAKGSFETSGIFLNLNSLLLM